MKQDPIEAFAALKDLTSIFHVKNIDAQLQTSLLNHGEIDWQSFLKLDIPYVLEYPMAMSELKNELRIFKEAFY